MYEYVQLSLAVGVFWVSVEAWVALCSRLGFPFARSIRKYGTDDV